MMSIRCPLLAGLLAASATLVVAAGQNRVEQVLSEARAALSGQPARALPGTFRITGTKAILTTAAGTKLPFEIHAELPERFVWRGEGGAAAATTVRGFNRGRLITNAPQDLAGGIPRAGAPTASERAAVSRDDEQLTIIRAHFATLTMGMFASGFKSVPLKFTDVEGGAGANAIGLQGQDGFGDDGLRSRNRPAELGGLPRGDGSNGPGRAATGIL